MVELNEEICELIGAYIGDGYLSRYGRDKKYCVFGICGHKILDNDYLSGYLYSLIKRNFPDTNPILHYKKNQNALLLRVYSQEFFDFFLNLGFKPGVKTRTILIPEIIMSNPILIRATIRGIFDTDGCVFFDKRTKYKAPYPRITIQLASIPLIKQLQSILSSNYSLYVNVSNRDGKRNTLEIYGQEQLERFLKEIGFSNKKHLSKIALVA